MSSPKRIQRIPHPAYNPDFAQFDFFPCDSIKRKLIDYDVLNRQSLKCAITHIFDEIGTEIFTAVFETWINRLEWVVEHERECFHQ
jgi:hypothetical protein